MDRREAVLRELNLYPCWVRRDLPAGVPAAEDVVVAETGAAASSVAEVPAAEVAAATGPLAEVPASAASLPEDRVQEASVAEVSMPPSPIADTAEAEAPPPMVVPPTDWVALKQTVRDCRACALRGGCTQTVFGVGDERAAWLFVGEGPGAEEDARGEPFVGQAGRLLDNMLAAMGLRRGQDVYITNVVKCRPPGNRAPQVEEVASCLPFLQQQISLIKPARIVALGRTAANALLACDSPLGKLRGQVHDFRGIPLIVTYHPSYLLRMPAEKARAWEDLRLALAQAENALPAAESCSMNKAV